MHRAPGDRGAPAPHRPGCDPAAPCAPGLGDVRAARPRPPVSVPRSGERRRASGRRAARRLPLRGAVATALSAAIDSPARSYEERLALSWPFMIEGCLDHLETGRRSVFDGWHVAHPAGGVCNGDPACEAPEMTFIARGEMGTGAVDVAVPGGDPVGDAPAEASCRSALGVDHGPDRVAEVHDRGLGSALAEGRLRPDGEGGLRGCAHDGGACALRFVFEEPSIAAFRARFPAEGSCPGAVS